MKTTDLTLLILMLNAAIDRGAKADWDETCAHIEAGDIFSWLKQQNFQIDVSLYTGSQAEVGNEIVREIQRIQGGYAGSERRKWGVQNNGLSLLLAWTNEIIQQKSLGTI